MTKRLDIHFNEDELKIIEICLRAGLEYFDGQEQAEADIEHVLRRIRVARTQINESLYIETNEELEQLTDEYKQYLSGKKKHEIISFKEFIESKKS